MYNNILFIIIFILLLLILLGLDKNNKIQFTNLDDKYPKKVDESDDANESEAKATNYSESTRYSAGLNFVLGSHITGGIRAGQINGRDDWKESYMAGSISIGF